MCKKCMFYPTLCVIQLVLNTTVQANRITNRSPFLIWQCSLCIMFFDDNFATIIFISKAHERSLNVHMVTSE
jgi:hypothetical protein